MTGAAVRSWHGRMLLPLAGLAALAVLLAAYYRANNTLTIGDREEVSCVSSSIAEIIDGDAASKVSCGRNYFHLQQLVRLIDGNDLEGARQAATTCIDTSASNLAQYYCRRYLDVVNIAMGKEYSGENGRFSATEEFARNHSLATLLAHVHTRVGRVGVSDPTPVDSTLPDVAYENMALPMVLASFVSNPPRIAIDAAHRIGTAVVIPGGQGIVVQFAANGTPVRMLVDTGSPLTVISQRAAGLAKVVRHPSRLGVKFFIAESDIPTEVGEVSIGMPGQATSRQSVRVIPTEILDPLGTDGIVGLDYLRRYGRLTVNLAEHKLTLGEFQEAGRCLPLHLVIYSNNEMLRLESSIRVFGRDIDWVIDTGMFRSIFYGSSGFMRWLQSRGLVAVDRRRIGDVFLDSTVAIAKAPKSLLSSDVLRVPVENLPGTTIDFSSQPLLDRSTDSAAVIGTPEVISKHAYSLDIAAHKLCVE